MKISFVKGSARQTMPSQTFSGTFEEFAQHFNKYRPFKEKHQDYFVRGELLGKRSNDNLPKAELLILDGDSSLLNPESAPCPERLHEILKELQYNHFIYTSYSYAPPARMKWRCVIPCIMTAEDQLKPTLNKVFHLLNENKYQLKNVKENWTWSQPWFLPNREKDDGHFLFFEYHEGRVLRHAQTTETKEDRLATTNYSDDRRFEELVDTVIKGSTFHEPLLNISYQLIKQGMPPASTTALLKGVMHGSAAASSNHARHKDWIERLPRIETEYVNGAVKRVGKTTKASKDELGTNETTDYPQFPRDTVKEWPEPWPMIWNNFARLSNDLNEPLLLPTVLSHASFILNSRFRNVAGRRPNFIFLNLSESTGGKDVNSRDILRSLHKVFQQRTSTLIQKTPFEDCLNYETSVTADSTFVESFDEAGRFFWINTESTNIWHQMSAAGSNSAVKGLSDKLIQVVDGHEITGKKRKAGGDVKGVDNPTCECLFYAQPDTIRKYVTMTQVDSGLLGRCLVSIIPRVDESLDDFSLFARQGRAEHSVDDEFYDFYMSQTMRSISRPVEDLEPSKESMVFIDEWFRNYARNYWNDPDNSMTYKTVLKRLGMSIEQLYTVVLGMCKLWDEFKGEEIRRQIDIKPLMPLIEFWTKSKIHTIEHLVSDDLDPLYAEVVDLLKRIIRGDVKVATTYQKIVDESACVPFSQFWNKLNNKRALKEKLSAIGDDKQVRRRVEELLKSGVRSGELFEEKHGRNQKLNCYGIAGY